MLQKLYIHNFRCLQNFTLKPGDNNALLLLGKNGVGKSTVGEALSLLQAVANGKAQAELLFHRSDMTLGRMQEQCEFAIELLLNENLYAYSLRVDFPEHFQKPRVVGEKFSVNGAPVFERKEGQVQLYTNEGSAPSTFVIDWHLVGLPFISERGEGHLSKVRSWLKNMHIIGPVPDLMGGDSSNNQEPLEWSCANFADALFRQLSEHPYTYSQMEKFLQEVMPDMKYFKNQQVSPDTRRLEIVFADETHEFQVNFKALSDGEKMFFLGAFILAYYKNNKNVFIFWDEPDSFIALQEVELFVRTLVKNIQISGQFWATTHNAQVIDGFFHENTFVLRRKNHLLPTQIDCMSDLIDSADFASERLRLTDLDL